MKYTLHKSEDRGKADHGWLKSRFSFSFADYRNLERLKFGKLRVLNDDIVAPSRGFGKHPHENMEIISIPTAGKLAHEDSTGGKEVIGPGEVQVMSAGTGVVHSEFNGSDTEDVKFFQLWIIPDTQEVEPKHASTKYELTPNELTLLVSGDEADGTLTIHQDAKILRGSFDVAQKKEYTLREGYGLFVMAIEGEATVDGNDLAQRDSLEISGAGTIAFDVSPGTDLLVVEVPL